MTTIVSDLIMLPFRQYRLPLRGHEHEREVFGRGEFHSHYGERRPNRAMIKRAEGAGD